MTATEDYMHRLADVTIWPGSRILVTGGRDYNDAEALNAVLSKLAPAEIAQGGASGADRLAALWAHETGTYCTTFPADWAKHGRAAGPIRNKEMLDQFKPDVVVAFPGGRGTAHMVQCADDCGVPVIDLRSVPTRNEAIF